MPDARASSAARVAHRDSQIAMLRVEAVALSALRRTADDAMWQNRRRPLAASQRLRARLPQVILDARRAARVASGATLAKELAVAAKEAGTMVRPPAAISTTTRADALAAHTIANSYADALLEVAQKAGNNVRAIAPRLDTIAATETAQAFSDQRRRIERADPQWMPGLVKVWDATLDRRICSQCAALANALRAWGDDWDGATPGQVHPNCRCMALYMFAPLYLGREAA